MKTFSLTMMLLVGLVMTTAFHTTASAQGKEIVRVCYLNWGKQGGVHLPEQGFIPDLLASVLSEAGYTPVIDIIPWKRCLNLVKKNRYDFVGSYWIGGEMDPWFDYFLPTTVDRINFVALKGSGLSSGKLEDLYGKRIGLLEGAGGLKQFRDQKDKFTVYEASDDMALIKMLRNRRLDAILSNSPHIIGLAETSFPELVKDIVVLEPPIQSNIASPAIAVSNPRRVEMKRRYNAAYKKLVAEGVYQRLMKKHDIRVDFTMTESDRKIFDAAQRD